MEPGELLQRCLEDILLSEWEHKNLCRAIIIIRIPVLSVHGIPSPHSSVVTLTQHKVFSTVIQHKSFHIESGVVPSDTLWSFSLLRCIADAEVKQLCLIPSKFMF